MVEVVDRHYYLFRLTLSFSLEICRYVIVDLVSISGVVIAFVGFVVL